MQGFIIKEGFVWLALVALTLFGYFNYESQGSSVAFVVLGAGLAKFLLIFFDFMEMKYAHRGWQVAMLLFVMLLFGAISFSL